MEVSGKRTDTEKEETAEELKKLCELCEADHVKTSANGICRECEEHMCSTCFRHHLKAKSCRHHVLIDTSESLNAMQRSAENVEKCKRHANETVKFYCRKHETVGCGECMIPEHFDCKPENVKHLSKEFEQSEEFKNIMAKIEAMMCSNSAIDKMMQQSKKENKRMLEEALNMIQNFRSEVNKHLDKAERNIIKEVKEIERNNDNLIVKLEQDCKALSSEITEVRQKLDTELYKGSALFIQSVECKPKIMDIERTCTKIQGENEITLFEFIPDEQLQGIITSIEKLGKLTRFKSPAKQETASKIKKAGREEVTEREKPTENVRGKAEKEKGRLEAGYMTVGSRVRSLIVSETWRHHYGQPGTVTAVLPDGRVDVKWDATGWTGTYTVGKDGELI